MAAAKSNFELLAAHLKKDGTARRIVDAVKTLPPGQWEEALKELLDEMARERRINLAKKP